MYKKIETEITKKPKSKIEKIFNRELEYFTNENVRNFTTEILRMSPGYFFSAPSSSSGKYHPAYENTKGGLVLHTKAVVYMVTQLCELDMFKFSEKEKNLLIAAALLHDSRKNGENPHCEYTVFNHPILAAEFIRKYSDCGIISKEDIDYIADAIASHMGQWNTHGKSSKYEPLPLPETKAQRFLHLCDYMASRKDINLSSYLFDPEVSTVTTEEVKETKVGFGKYKGKTYNEIFNEDPEYLNWIYSANMKMYNNGEKPYLSLDVLNGIKRILFVENM